MNNSIPCLKKQNENTFLMVKDKPLFLRAGEIHNSAASTLEYLEKTVWNTVRTMHLNGLIVPVYWECVEPEEGRFDFSLVDGIITKAREEELHLILLWFGLWKNGNSDYVPGWIKRDGQRFTRMLNHDSGYLRFRGKNNFTISPLCKEAVDADKRGFIALMEHLKEIDGLQHTVVMMQVENEIGVLGSDRDYSGIAQAAFEKEVPEELVSGMKLSGGSWDDCFGNDAAEKFMAWHYAKAVEEIAAAGKKAYPLPMYCNAWLRQEPRIAGEYPSGGPQLHNQDVWRIASPSIDFYAPDIYLTEYREICDAYREAGNPLCIPEVRRTSDATSYYFYALGQHGVMCFAPFGIEDMMGREEILDEVTLSLLDISVEAMRSGPIAGDLLTQAYALTEGMGEILTEAIMDGRTHGFLDRGEMGINIPLKNCLLRVEYDKKRKPGEPLSGGMVVELSEDEFVLIGTRCGIAIEGYSGTIVEAERYEEGFYKHGVWQRSRILNGDERVNVRCHVSPRMIRCKIFSM